jgi:hypothetical protein
MAAPNSDLQQLINASTKFQVINNPCSGANEQFSVNPAETQPNAVGLWLVTVTPKKQFGCCKDASHEVCAPINGHKLCPHIVCVLKTQYGITEQQLQQGWADEATFIENLPALPANYYRYTHVCPRCTPDS